MSNPATTAGFDLPRTRRPGPAAWMQLILAEIRSVVRDTAGLVLPIGLPLLLMVTQAFSTSQEVVTGTGGLSVLEVYILPISLVMVIALIGVVNMPSFLASYRRDGLLKRLAATPVHPAMVLLAQVVTSVLQTIIGLALGLTVAALAFGIRGPQQLWATVAVMALVAAAMYALGMIVAAIAPSTNAAIAIGLAMFFLIGATGGMFGGAGALPQPLAQVGELLPYGAGVAAVTATWLGEPVAWQHLAALAGVVLVGSVSAVTLFRWSR